MHPCPACPPETSGPGCAHANLWAPFARLPRALPWRSRRRAAELARARLAQLAAEARHAARGVSSGEGVLLLVARDLQQPAPLLTGGDAGRALAAAAVPVPAHLLTSMLERWGLAALAPLPAGSVAAELGLGEPGRPAPARMLLAALRAELGPAAADAAAGLMVGSTGTVADACTAAGLLYPPGAAPVGRARAFRP